MRIHTEHCNYPGCGHNRQIDPDKKTFISAIPYFCGDHVWCYIRCNHPEGCDRYNIYPTKEDVPPTWNCNNHAPEQIGDIVTSPEIKKDFEQAYPAPLPVTDTKSILCSFPECPERTLLEGMKVWYCRGHSWAYNMTDQQIAYCMESHKEFDPEKKTVIHFTHEQTAQLREMLKEHGDPQLGLRPMPPVVVGPDLQRQVDIAMLALDKILQDPDDETISMVDADLHLWVEATAKDAIDAIRKLRDA